MFPAPRAPLAPSDPLFPTVGLLPLADPGGGHVPVANVAGELRPFAVTLAVPPPADAKKHDTISTRWTENHADATVSGRPGGTGYHADRAHRHLNRSDLKGAAVNAATTVLVLTGAGDDTADAVVEQLHKRDTAVVRMDIGDFPQRLHLAAALDGPHWQGLLTCDDVAVALADIRSVYYRRPTRFGFSPEMSSPDAMFAAAEARGGLGGVLAALDVFWVNDPSLAARAEYKPLQLRVAADEGLLVPPTLVTNDHAAAAAFAAVHGPVVAKTLSSVVLGDDNGQPLITYTTRVNVADIDPAGFAATANLLQRWVAKAMDCRVTMVGDRPYAAAVRCDSVAGHVDWRADYPALTYEPIEVPDAVVAGMIRYLERFGLHFAAFDFGIDHNGVWWYYEANPAGQWLWIEEATGLDISGGLADLLVEGKLR